MNFQWLNNSRIYVVKSHKEEGCSLEPVGNSDSANALLNQLASTEAVVWSPQADQASVQALSDLLGAAHRETNAGLTHKRHLW